MEYGQTLIDKAGDVCGSFYKLSKETGFSQGTISDVRSGKRPLPLEWVPVLAEIAQVEPRDALAYCLAERLPENSRARQILGGGWAGNVAAMLLFFVVLALGMPLSSFAKERERGPDASQCVNYLYIVERLNTGFSWRGWSFALFARMRRRVSSWWSDPWGTDSRLRSAG